MKIRGVTLIELIIVMSVLAILGTVMLARMPSVELFRAYGFSGVLLHDLMLTKALSMTQNQRYRIVIGASSYQIQDQNSVAISHPETQLAAVTYPSGVSITPTTTVIFDSLGQPYDATNTALSTTLDLTVTATGTSQTVSITPETGFMQ